MKSKKINTATFKSFVILLMMFGTGNFICAQNWTQIASGTSKKLNSICFPSSTVGYIAGNDSLLLKTTDGGSTWNAINYSGINFFLGGEHLLNLQFLNDSVGFVTVGPYSGSYGTTDGGLTWTAINLPGNLCYNKGMYFFNENSGFIGGSGCFQGELISTLSNGNWQTGTWNMANINASTNVPSNIISDIHFYNANLGMAASKSGYVFKTNDGGINWDTAGTPSLYELTSILVVNDTLAYAGYTTTNSGFGLYISTDGGLTWDFDMNSATFFYPNFFSLHQSNDGTIYTGGVSPFQQVGLIFKNPGQFMMWDYDQVDQAIYDFSSHSDSIVFAVGDSGLIVVNYPQLLTGQKLSLQTNDEIIIFPNPAKNTLFIKANNGNSLAHVKYRILNTLSQQVKIGNLNTSIDISSLEAGIYFIEIENNGQLITKKFVAE
jgi:photosystem II stability/assembly factor-like uncharacterized protein